MTEDETNEHNNRVQAAFELSEIEDRKIDLTDLMISQERLIKKSI